LRIFHMPMRIFCVLITILAAVNPSLAGGRVTFKFVDDQTSQPIAVHMRLIRSGGTAAPIRRGIRAEVGYAVDGAVRIDLPADTYQFVIDRGPEYHEVRGAIALQEGADDEKTIRVPRVASLAEEGWWGGDPLALIPAPDVDLRRRAANLRVVGLAHQFSDREQHDAPTETPQAMGANFPRLIRGEGDASDLFIFFGGSPLAVESIAHLPAGRAGPSSDFIRGFVTLAPDGQPSIDRPRLAIANPMAWDLPIWLASGRVDGLVVMGEFLRAEQETRVWPNSRPPRGLEFTGSRGLGLWSLEIYRQLLEAGIRVAPLGSAGSGFQANPLGHCLTYVYLADADISPSDQIPESVPDATAWWDGLWRGRTVVTSGPLLRPLLDGFPPGHHFVAAPGQTLELTLALDLAIRQPVDYLDVLQNGKVVYKARLDEFARAGGRIAPLQFDSSGWVQVRVMTKHETHYRGAISAPWYVDFAGQERISRSAVQFFQDWLAERERMLSRLPADEIARHAPYVRGARTFWEGLASRATVP
jgi:hypothetical protein